MQIPDQIMCMLSKEQCNALVVLHMMVINTPSDKKVSVADLL
jgi:hypothetical protein